MTPDNGQDPESPENPPPASAPTPPPKVFSEAEAQSALAWLKAKAAAQKAAAAAPPPPATPDAVEMSAEELAASPEEARRRFDAAVADLREAFGAWVAAKQAQFEQLLVLGCSGEHDDMAAFLKHLEQERERIQMDAAQTASDIHSTAEVNELAEIEEKLADMKPTWDKLRAEGVPIGARDLIADLPWSIQFQFQAETDPTGKDMEWWRAHKADFDDL